jgi:hypothetical protein
LRLPLPWFTGTLIAVAGLSMAGVSLLPRARDNG